MELFVGTSGYSYKEWKGIFYPDSLPPAGMLQYYGQRFNAVEINNTFYRMPGEELLQRWACAVPGDFRFALKAPRRITHVGKLAIKDDSLAFLLEVTATLGHNLGPLLFQLPPYLKKGSTRLLDFIDALPGDRLFAFEFRHASWLDDEVLRLLQEKGMALCLTDIPAVNPPLCSWGYLRLRQGSYTDEELRRWVAWLRNVSWREAYVFFKHETGAPDLAVRFRRFFQQDSLADRSA